MPPINKNIKATSIIEKPIITIGKAITTLILSTIKNNFLPYVP